MAENWANKTIDNKTEWERRPEYVGSSNSIGVQDNRFHLGDDKAFTYGYDSDWIISYQSSQDVLSIAHSNSSISVLSFSSDGRLNLRPHSTASSLVKNNGALASISKIQGNGVSSPYQLHLSKIGRAHVWSSDECSSDVL